MPDEVNRHKQFRDKFASLDRDYLKSRPPNNVAVRPGDKIWVNRRLVRLVPDREQSDEYMEVIDVVKRND